MFETQQVNNLLTGVVLACEVKDSDEEHRKFLTVRSFDISKSGKPAAWDKTVKPYDRGNNALFVVHYYSVKARYMQLNYDIDDNDLTKNIIIDHIYGWDQLYNQLSKFINNYSELKPQWHCDNPLE
ncbi:MAG: hypothetical protein Q4F95_12295 [Oscillospiraceae bacterium]|nr:hypothetical protein [Oscillospiraceae bacterium]